ncbi:hypothetical protein A9179_13650 [Pseudomonas alcaligenes]|uniref:DUF1353 domain-containing protein n=1 Tax=Aquipseudomonas alcaligenes TaxID=43263 RepID=A0ABR7S2N3_AQUAC|nr:DUF1353 domain-containing protein [Pseudomonas alcaligenes]MBC9251314.1 hypothetical protein [Pseudomonas alcaligenes]
MQFNPLQRPLVIHFGNLLVSALGLLLLGLAAWLRPALIAPLLWIAIPVYLGVLLPRWLGRGERVRRAAAARQADQEKWGFGCREHAGPWLNFIDRPLLRHCPQFAGRYFYGEWLLIHDGLLIINPGQAEVDLPARQVRYDFQRPTTYAWDGCTPKVPFYWLAIIGIPDWWEKRHHVLRLEGDLLYQQEVFWPLAHPASLVHDALYQYLNVAPVAKHEADLLFFHMLREAGMVWPLAFAYYLAVRLFGATDVRHGRPANTELECLTPLPQLIGTPSHGQGPQARPHRPQPDGAGRPLRPRRPGTHPVQPGRDS